LSATGWKYGDAVERTAFHYVASGLDDVYLLSGYERYETDYGSGISITDIDGLHHAIAENIALHKKTLNGKEIRFLRKQMKLSQDELGVLLGASEQTVGRWEKGQSAVPGPADLSVRGLFLSQDSGNIDLVELAKSIRAISCDANRQEFVDTEDGWKIAA
jgi:DNA-binding transcriptional regulator YiaG